MIFNLIKKSFNTVIENPSITFYFVLFLIILNFLAYYITTSNNFYVSVTLITASLLLSFAFSSGWFQVIKESCDKEKIKEKNYFSIFLEGVGKNIIPVSIAMIVYFLLFAIVIYLTSLIANALFGNLNFILNDILTPQGNTLNINEFLNNLSDSQKYTLYAWQLSFMAAGALFNFVLMFYFPAVIKDSDKNIFLKPFFAFLNSICFLFKNFLGAVSIFLLIYALYFLMSFSRMFISSNNFLMVLLLFIYIYFISTSIMLIFNYYEQKNLCNNGSDSIGQDETCNKISEEN